MRFPKILMDFSNTEYAFLETLKAFENQFGFFGQRLANWRLNEAKRLKNSPPDASGVRLFELFHG